MKEVVLCVTEQLSQSSDPYRIELLLKESIWKVASQEKYLASSTNLWNSLQEASLMISEENLRKGTVYNNNVCSSYISIQAHQDKNPITLMYFQVLICSNDEQSIAMLPEKCINMQAA